MPVQPRRYWSHFASEELRSPDFAVLEGLYDGGQTGAAFYKVDEAVKSIKIRYLVQNRYKFFAESSGVDYCPSTRQSIFRGGQDQTQSSPFAANLLIRPPRAWPIRSTGTIGVGPP